MSILARSTLSARKVSTEQNASRIPSLLARNHARFLRSFYHQLASFVRLHHESVVLAKFRPWPQWHLAEIDKFPIGHVGRLQPEIIAHGRRDIEARALI